MWCSPDAPNAGHEAFQRGKARGLHIAWANPTPDETMRLSTRAHGFLDYATGILLIAAPWMLGFARGGAETWVPVAVGASVLAYSLLTDYELGVVRRIQVPVHLWLDGLGGLFLAASPWIFAFDEHVWIPHVAAGVFEMLVAFLTNTIPGYERRRGART